MRMKTGCYLLAFAWVATGCGAELSHAAKQEQTTGQGLAQTDKQSAVEAVASSSRQSILVLDDVLASARTHTPQILAAIAEREVAAGKALSAEGAFDTRLKSEAYGRLSGFYDGKVLDSEVRRRLRNNGAELYAGYKLSDGSFPIYEDESYTDTLGAFKIGFLLPLLRDRSFDDARFGISDAALLQRKADFELLLTKIGVQHEAILAYNVWLGAGLRLAVLQDLLELARTRETALTRRVAEGDAPEILITENRQNILRRESLVLEASRDLQLAAYDLAPFWRGQEGRPLIASQSQLPGQFGNVADLVDLLAAVDSMDIGQRRPERAIIENALDQARNRLRLRENEVLPRVDVGAEYQRDLGSVAEGGISRQGDDIIVGFKVTVPLENRAAKGKIAEERARIKALQWRRQRLDERIELEILAISQNLTAASDLVLIADQEVEQAQAMQNAEERRFSGGASDFFLLNRREESTADARIGAIRARLRYFQERANFDAATLNLARLGLEQ